MNLIAYSNYSKPRQALLRACVFVLVGCVMLVAQSSRLVAGCHYGGHESEQMKHDENPRAHARNFSFLGQWVYERGEMKYVPWQGHPPCHGPNCKADKPLPPSSVAPETSVSRIPTIILISAKSNSFRSDARCGWLRYEDSLPLSGFAFEHEHPPRLLEC